MEMHGCINHAASDVSTTVIEEKIVEKENLASDVSAIVIKKEIVEEEHPSSDVSTIVIKKEIVEEEKQEHVAHPQEMVLWPKIEKVEKDVIQASPCEENVPSAKEGTEIKKEQIPTLLGTSIVKEEPCDEDEVVIVPFSALKKEAEIISIDEGTSTASTGMLVNETILKQTRVKEGIHAFTFSLSHQTQSSSTNVAFDACKNPAANKCVGTEIRKRKKHSVFQCDPCKMKFSNKKALKKHKNSTHALKLYTCDICKKSFAQSLSLNHHMRSHPGSVPFSCDVCKKEFSYQRSLQTHMKCHRAHTCGICHKKFSKYEQLIQHMNSTPKTHLRIGKRKSSMENYPKNISTPQNWEILNKQQIYQQINFFSQANESIQHIMYIKEEYKFMPGKGN